MAQLGKERAQGLPGMTRAARECIADTLAKWNLDPICAEIILAALEQAGYRVVKFVEVKPPPFVFNDDEPKPSASE